MFFYETRKKTQKAYTTGHGNYPYVEYYSQENFNCVRIATFLQKTIASLITQRLDFIAKFSLILYMVLKFERRCVLYSRLNILSVSFQKNTFYIHWLKLKFEMIQVLACLEIFMLNLERGKCLQFSNLEMKDCFDHYRIRCMI